MINDEHNPEGTDYAAQGHYLAASKTTPPDAIVYAANNPAHNTMPVSDYDGPTVYFTGSQITPPAPTPTLPDEVREAIAAEIYATPYASLQASDRLSVDFACSALAPLWPRPAAVTAAKDAEIEMHKRSNDIMRGVADQLRAALAEAKQEVERLTVREANDVAAYSEAADKEIADLRAQLADARQAVAAALADKERLDWLEANLCYAMVAPDGIHMTQLASPHGKGWQNGNLRIALDTARREGGAQ